MCSLGLGAYELSVQPPATAVLLGALQDASVKRHLIS
jgi:hypothetical protein